MSIFGNIKKQGVLDDVVNFDTFGNSMLLLFRLSTAAGWNNVLESLMVQPPNCELDYKGLHYGNCGSALNAVTYLVSYIVLMFFIVVNMYIAVIIENIKRIQENLNFVVTKDNLDDYYRKWSHYTSRRGSQYLSLDLVPEFVDQLLEPLRIKKPNTYELAKMDIPVYSNKDVHCFSLLKALVTRSAVLAGESIEVIQPILSMAELRYKKQFKNKGFDEIVSSTRNEFALEFAVMTIQRAIRAFLLKRRIKQHQNQFSNLSKKHIFDNNPGRNERCTRKRKLTDTYGFVFNDKKVLCVECASKFPPKRPLKMKHAQSTESFITNNPLHSLDQNLHGLSVSHTNVNLSSLQNTYNVLTQTDHICEQGANLERITNSQLDVHNVNETKNASTQPETRKNVSTQTPKNPEDWLSSVQTSNENIYVILNVEKQPKLEAGTPDTNHSGEITSCLLPTVSNPSTPSVYTACSSDINGSEADESSFSLESSPSDEKQRVTLQENVSAGPIQESKKTQISTKEVLRFAKSGENLTNSTLNETKLNQSNSKSVQEGNKITNGAAFFKNDNEKSQKLSTDGSKPLLEKEPTAGNEPLRDQSSPADETVPKHSLLRLELEKGKYRISAWKNEIIFTFI